MLIRYRILTAKNSILNGERMFSSEAEARIFFASQGADIIDISVKTFSSNSKFNFLKRDPSLHTLVILFDRWSALLEEHTNLIESLKVLQEAFPKLSLNHVLMGLEQGQNLARSITFMKGGQDPFIISLIRFGEELGGLPHHMRRIHDGLYKKWKRKDALNKILRQPFITFIVLMMTFYMMLTFLVPIIFDMWRTQGKSLDDMPWLAKKWHQWTEVSWKNEDLIGFFICFGIIFFLIYKRNFLFQIILRSLKRWHQFQEFVHAASYALFFEQLGWLLSHGIEFMEGYSVCLSFIENRFLKQHLQKVYDGLLAGQPFAEALKEQSVGLPHLYIHLIGLGTSNGQLARVLNSLSIMVYHDHDRYFESLCFYLPQGFIILWGGLFIWLLSSILLPLYGDFNFLEF